jgi:hypothetical protein
MEESMTIERITTTGSDNWRPMGRGNRSGLSREYVHGRLRPLNDNPYPVKPANWAYRFGFAIGFALGAGVTLAIAALAVAGL